MRKHILFAIIVFLFTLNLKAENPIIIGNARFTFYSPTLVRMEYAINNDFLDDPTLFANNREPKFNQITITKQGKRKYILATSKLKIVYDNDFFPFGQCNIQAFFKVKNKEKRWGIASQPQQNLKGTIVTLDGVGSPQPLDDGLLTRDGWYIIDDTGKDIIKNNWIACRSKNHLQDLYLFAYGTDYKAALKDLKKVSGNVPMTRKYVHGAWYCRWWNYTTEEYKQIANEYTEHKFPLDILVFDMGWHTQNATTGTGHAGTRGWVGYSWNKKLISNPKELIHSLNKKNIQVVLNEHPHDGIRHHETMYADFMKAMGEDTIQQKELLFDASNQKYMENFMKYAHQSSDSMGVAFWWLDWQQDYLYPVVRGTQTKHIPWLNKIYYDYSEKNNLRGCGYSRWGGWGSHRYPIFFSGDAVGNWDVLKFEIELNSTSGNAGCFFWAHDIGGFFGGNSPELYTRWTQFGLVSSSLRIHSVYDKNLDRRPWLWGAEAEKNLRNLYHWRSRLMPYIYSSIWQCHKDMLPLNRSMYIEYKAEEAYHNPQQFMFGDLLLCAPITSSGKGPNKIATQNVWLPKGDYWYHLFENKQYKGGQKLEAKSDLASFPIYVKGGYPLPMQNYTPNMTSDKLSELIIRCYPGTPKKTRNYTLYEDDGISLDYKKGMNAFTKMDYTQNEAGANLIIHGTNGFYKEQLKKRSYRIELPCIDKPQKVRINGHSTKAIYDKNINGYIIRIKEKNCRQKQNISILY